MAREDEPKPISEAFDAASAKAEEAKKDKPGTDVSDAIEHGGTSLRAASTSEQPKPKPLERNQLEVGLQVNCVSITNQEVRSGVITSVDDDDNSLHIKDEYGGITGLSRAYNKIYKADEQKPKE